MLNKKKEAIFMQGSIDLRGVTIRGFLWVMLGELFQQSIALLAMLILARLLVPEHFGMMATAYIFIRFAELVRDGGSSIAIIQKKDIDDQYLSTAFFVNLFMGIILFIVTFVTAGKIAAFFSNDKLTMILRILSLKFIIDSAASVHQTILTKKLNFIGAMLPRLGGIFVYGLTAVVLASFGYGVWSLVLATIMSSLVSLVFSWGLDLWRPAFIFDIDSLRKLFRFGINVMGINLVRYLKDHIDYLIIARYLGMAELGYYFMAYTVSSYFTYKLKNGIEAVLFPVLSQLNKNREIKLYYLKVIKLSILIVFPIYLTIILTGREFILYFFGKGWLRTTVPLQILCMLGVLRSLVVAPVVLYSKGRPDIIFKWSSFHFLISTIAILIGVSRGIVGVSSAVLVSGCLCLPIIIHISNSIIEVRWIEYLGSVWRVVIASFSMIVFLLISKILIPQNVGYYIIRIAAGWLIYIAILKKMGINVLMETKRIYKLAFARR